MILKNPKTKKPEAQKPDDDKGILASLIFLKGEVKKANMEKTEKLLDEAIAAFFRDMQSAGKLDGNFEVIQEFLQRVLSLGKDDLADFIRLARFFDVAEDGETRN